MNDTPSTAAVLDQLERLTVTYGKPFGQAVRKQAEEYAAAFCRVGLPMSAVTEAVNQSISLGKRFPSASELIERGREFIPRTDGERNRPPADHCPHCGILYFYAGYEFCGFAPRGLKGESQPRTVWAKLRCGCPQEDPSWYTEDALAWHETDPKIEGHRKPRDYETNRQYRTRPTVTRTVRGGAPSRIA